MSQNSIVPALEKLKRFRHCFTLNDYGGGARISVALSRVSVYRVIRKEVRESGTLYY